MIELPFCPFTGLDSLFLIVKREPLCTKPWLYRTLARWVYARIGWASDYGVEYIGWRTSLSAARKAVAGRPGWSYTEIPFSADLPADTCAFRCHDFSPESGAGAMYRNRELAIVATPQVNVTALQNSVAELRRAIAGT